MDGRRRTMRDPSLHRTAVPTAPRGTPQLCADRLAATHERTGIDRFALLVEGTGDLAASERNVQRLGEEVLTQLPPAPDSRAPGRDLPPTGSPARGAADPSGRGTPASRSRSTQPLPSEQRQRGTVPATLGSGSAVAERRRLVEQLSADRGEARQPVVDRRVQREYRDPVAVLEGEPHTEVPLQRAAYRVAGQRAQQLTSGLLVRRRGLVVGELARRPPSVGPPAKRPSPRRTGGTCGRTRRSPSRRLRPARPVPTVPVRRRATWVLLSRPLGI